MSYAEREGLRPKGNVPTLRFPEFQGEWEKFTFDEIAQYKKGPFGSALKKDIFVPQSEDTIKVYEQQNAIKKDWTLSRYYITKGYFNSHMKQFVAKVGDLIVSCAGTIGEIYELPQDAEEGVFNQALMRVQVNDEAVNKEIFITVFSSMIDKFSKIYSNGSAIKNIPPFADLKKTQVFLPCKEEQKKIAKLLALLDERIATQSKIIEDLKKLKSAISKLLFAQKPNGWNRLDTLFSKGKAGGTPTSTNKEYYNGEIPFLSINDITKQGKYVRCTENYLSQSGLENSSAWVVPKYSLIMSMYASVGLVTINEKPLATSQAMFAMQLKDKNLLDYLYYYLSYFKYRHIHKYLETGTQSNINADIVRGIMIPTYGYRHNIEIASTLQGVDAKIDNELSVLEQLHRQKNYFLSQMFI